MKVIWQWRKWYYKFWHLVLPTHAHTHAYAQMAHFIIVIIIIVNIFWPLWIICNKFYYIINSTENCKTLKITRSICLHLRLPFPKDERWWRMKKTKLFECDVCDVWFYENGDDFCPFCDYAIQINAFTSLSSVLNENKLQWMVRTHTVQTIDDYGRWVGDFVSLCVCVDEWKLKCMYVWLLMHILWKSNVWIQLAMLSRLIIQRK